MRARFLLPAIGLLGACEPGYLKEVPCSAVAKDWIHDVKDMVDLNRESTNDILDEEDPDLASSNEEVLDDLMKARIGKGKEIRCAVAKNPAHNGIVGGEAKTGGYIQLNVNNIGWNIDEPESVRWVAGHTPQELNSMLNEEHDLDPRFPLKVKEISLSDYRVLNDIHLYYRKILTKLTADLCHEQGHVTWRYKHGDEVAEKALSTRSLKKRMEIDDVYGIGAACGLAVKDYGNDLIYVVATGDFKDI